MINLLIIDDESLIRKYIKKIVTDNFSQCCILGEAENSEDAMNKIIDLKPDLIITDICLNEHNGLDIFNVISSNAKIIVITGYRNFEYAHQAISLNVSALLLKPINPAELVSAIKKVIEEIESENGKKEEIQRLNRFVSDNISYIQQKFLLDMIYGVYSENLPKAAEIATDLNINLHGHYLFLSEITFFGSESDDAEYSVTDEIFEYLCLHTSDDINIYKLFANAGKSILLLEDSKNSFDNQKLQDLCNCTVAHFESLHDDANIRISVSSKGNSIQDLNRNYRECSEALSGLDNNRGAILYSSSMNRTIESDGELVTALSNLKKLIIAAIDKKDATEIQTYLLKSVDTVKKLEKTNKEEIIIFYTGIFLYLNDIRNENISKQGEGYFDYVDNIEKNIASCTSIDMLNDLLLLIIQNTLETKKLTNSNFASSHVDMAIKYIHENYSANISLNDVSNYIHLSPVHTGRIFKKSVGITITEYINEYRIKKACKFLETGNYKIYEIAEKVGINSTNYFVTLFKKHMGVTPSEYLKKIK